MMPPQVFAILRMLIEERTGLKYGAEDIGLIGDKLASRCREAGFESFLDYYYYLRYDPSAGDEFDQLIDSLVVNETYFFREAVPLTTLIDEVLMPALSARKTARVWSAACATGEEPFTIAMLLAQRGVLDEVEIVATDISTRALSLARSASFRPRSIRDAKLPAFAKPWLDVSADRAVLAPRIRDAVRFSRLNLMDGAAIREQGVFDAILCRNVLIYFSDETIQGLVENLTRSLRPGGSLLVGASESLLRFSTALVCEERRGAFLYRRIG
jgi:chemotaxis protein methyltransferase CheR